MKAEQRCRHSKVIVFILLIFITAAGGFLRFYQIGKLSFWLDEAFTFINSRGDLIQAVRTDPNMLLFDVLAHGWIRAFPDASDGTLRALAAIFSVAGIPVTFLLGQAMTPDRKKADAIGLIAAFLIAVNAFNIQYAQEFRSYSLTFFLATLSTLLLIRAVQDGGSKPCWAIGYILATVAAIYSHFYVAFLVAAQALTLPFFLPDRARLVIRLKPILYCGAAMALLVFPIALVAFRKGSGGIAWIPEPTVETVKNFLVDLSGHSSDGRWLLALYALSGGIGLFFGEGARFSQDRITLWKFLLAANCFCLPVIAALAISKTVTPIFIDRYLLYVMPYPAVLAAAGIVALSGFGWRWKKLSRFFVPVGCGVLVLFALLSMQGVRSYYETFQKANWRDATGVLAGRCSESLRLYYSPYIERAVLYYDPELRSQVADQWKEMLQDRPTAEELAASLPEDFRQVCLVLGHVESEEQVRTIRAAIRQGYPDESTIEFYDVEVEIYRRKEPSRSLDLPGGVPQREP